MVVAAEALRPRLNDGGEYGRQACLDQQWPSKQHWRHQQAQGPWPVRRSRQQWVQKPPWQQPQQRQRPLPLQG